jgi:hypothetical protein
LSLPATVTIRRREADARLVAELKDKLNLVPPQMGLQFWADCSSAAVCEILKYKSFLVLSMPGHLLTNVSRNEGGRWNFSEEHKYAIFSLEYLIGLCINSL